MTYEKQIWKNGESYLNQDTLNHIEDGIESAHQAIENLSVSGSPIKQFHAVVTAKDGVWTLDYSSAGFTKILAIQSTGQASGTALADRTIASLGNTEPTLTGCSGVLMSASAAGLLAATTLVNASGKVHVSVFGE